MIVDFEVLAENSTSIVELDDLIYHRSDNRVE